MIRRWTEEPPVVEEEARPKGFDDFDLRLGDIMRGERATMAKSLLDVQRELKIKATYIAAIENADPSAFETQGFIAGYVRSYARYLNLDPEWAYARFCSEANFATSHGMSPAASSNTVNVDAPVNEGPRDPFAADAVFVPQGEALFSRIEPGAIGSSLVLVALIAGIGFGGWSVLQEIQKVQFAPVAQAPGVTSTLEGSSVTTVDRDDSVSASDALDRLYRPQALDVPVLVARDGPIATLDPSLGGTLSDPSTIAEVSTQTLTPIAENAPVQVVSGDLPEVVLFAVRPSWIRVSSVDGTVLFEKILDAGERYELPSTEEAPLLRAGNAGSIYFAVNGETYGPAGDGPSVVKGVALSSDDLKRAYSVADLSKDNDLAKVVAVAHLDGQSTSD